MSNTTQNALKELDILALNREINADATGVAYPNIDSILQDMSTKAQVKRYEESGTIHNIPYELENILYLDPTTPEYSEMIQRHIEGIAFPGATIGAKIPKIGLAKNLLSWIKQVNLQKDLLSWAATRPQGSISKKLVQSVDKAVATLAPKPTKEFVAKAKSRVFEDLGSYDAWKRWKNTMDKHQRLMEMPTSQGVSVPVNINDLSYKDYRTHVKKSLDLFNDTDLINMDRVLSEGDIATHGLYSSEGSRKGIVELNPYKKVLNDPHSTAVHEYTHKTQLAPIYQPTKLTGGTVLEGGQKRIGVSDNMPYLGNQIPFKQIDTISGDLPTIKWQSIARPLGFEWELKYWDKIKPYFTDEAKKSIKEIKKFSKIDPLFAPKDIQFIKYLLRPREISARIAQLREGNAPQWIIDQLKRILTPEGIEFAKKNLWGAAGIGAFDEMIDSSSDPADNLFKDSE